MNLHIKDFAITRIQHQMGFEILGTPAGSGRLDIKQLLALMSEKGQQPTAILELWTPYMDSVEETIKLEQAWFKQSMAYLRQFDFT